MVCDDNPIELSLTHLLPKGRVMVCDDNPIELSLTHLLPKGRVMVCDDNHNAQCTDSQSKEDEPDTGGRDYAGAMSTSGYILYSSIPCPGQAALSASGSEAPVSRDPATTELSRLSGVLRFLVT
ncbi:hypothetical protein J6590_025740 [Homalodisca vitripennis]|nr:hypothetical protein J6590_025740 [Homalodisca vitripennis]